MRITHIGGPTVLVEVAGWRILTDPTFDAPGRSYSFGWGSGSTKLAGPSAPLASLLPIDAVLVTHDHHDDNLDAAGREALPLADVVVTTASGAKRLGGAVRGLEPWSTTELSAPGRPSLTVTATPCRHGPPLFHPIVGDVIGFHVRWNGGTLWITGDTVLYGGVLSVADHLDVDVALVHLGGVQFGVTGPLRYTMTGRDAVKLLSRVRPRVAIPIHYEGWKHFRDGRASAEEAFAAAPAAVRSAIRWLPIGEPNLIGEAGHRVVTDFPSVRTAAPGDG